MSSHKILEDSSEGDPSRQEANYDSLPRRSGPDFMLGHFGADEASMSSSGSIGSLHCLQPPPTTPTPTSLPAPGSPGFYLPPPQPAIQPALAPALKSSGISAPPTPNAGQTAKRYSRPTTTKRTKKLSDEWTNVTEPDERRRIQNRLAQRKFREKAREAKERAERLRASQEQQAESSFRFPHQVADAQKPSEPPGLGSADVRSSRHALHRPHEGSLGHRPASSEDPLSPMPPLDSQQRHLHYPQHHLTHQMRQQTVSYPPQRPSAPSPVQPPFNPPPDPASPYVTSHPTLSSYSQMPYNLPQPYSPPKTQSTYSPLHYVDSYTSTYADRGRHSHSHTPTSQTY